MATNQTTNYELNQWLSTDPVVRTDFNADNAKLDAALAGKASTESVSALQTSLAGKADQEEVDELADTVPKLAVGSYTGDGTASRTISLGFTPKAVPVFTQYGYTTAPGSSSSNITRYYGGLAVTGAPVISIRSATVLAVQTGGFQVSENASDYAEANQTDMVYHYLALG